ncbi:hypothetical protein AVEN_138917-1 [Araneus ventricosus]|uniref:Uncharacterized protein n=1 Tax=Araneus ventricosus TaxID=182803 RepID=A0A4Y2TJV6_ARAVE|nr:hypothetical protein AVEN_107235-1 [Araneus ventricosus]GBO00504.1 hypothetical protein AVEN_182919-1 [Araneus ventricosus]GBO00531.1 hypothetical protein AVEN_125471-1 [Araneus ventricosus]GBO00933.1 hypothetical protein AVEN_138917-1 [Araneus ventricosus]
MCSRGRMWSGVVVQQRDTFREQFPPFPVKCLLQQVQRGTITGSIHGHYTRMEMNHQQTLVVTKDCDHNFLRGWYCFDLLMGRRRGASL